MLLLILPLISLLLVVVSFIQYRSTNRFYDKKKQELKEFHDDLIRNLRKK